VNRSKDVPVSYPNDFLGRCPRRRNACKEA
jgi:hypothetical protein